MGSVPDDYQCPWCGRIGNGGYASDPHAYAICCNGKHSCVFFQISTRGFGLEEFRTAQLRAIWCMRDKVTDDNSTDVNGKRFLRNVASFLGPKFDIGSAANTGVTELSNQLHFGLCKVKVNGKVESICFDDTACLSCPVWLLGRECGRMCEVEPGVRHLGRSCSHSTCFGEHQWTERGIRLHNGRCGLELPPTPPAG